MPKKIIQDVIPPENRKSVRNIPVPTRVQKGYPRQGVQPITSPDVLTRQKPSLRATTRIVTKFQNSETEEHPSKSSEVINTIPSTFDNKISEKRNYKNGLLTALGIVVTVFFGYILFLFFNTGALVSIVPKERTSGLSSSISFSAKKNPLENELGFEVIELTEEIGKSVPTSGEKNVEKKAVGRVILYNDFSTTPQRIIKNTRLETEDGKIYRIDSSVVIPGQTRTNGKTSPGSIEVSATADTSGDEYNIGLVDFTIPGFKDEPDKFAKYYARSKTPMTGGYKGSIKTAKPEDREAGLKEVTANLKERLLSKAKEQVTSDFILFDKSAFFTLEQLTPPESSEVRVRATIHGIMFNRLSLSKMIAKKTLPQYDDSEDVAIPELEKIVFSPDSLEIAPWQTGNLPFTLSGTTTIRWTVDENKLKSDLAGLAKNTTDNVFKTYPGIEKAEVEVTPGWKSTLPEDPSKITIKFIKDIVTAVIKP